MAFLLYLALIGGALTLLIRKQNEINFNIDEEENLDEIESDDLDNEFVEKPGSVESKIENQSESDLSSPMPTPEKNSTKRKVSRKSQQMQGIKTQIERTPQNVTKRRRISNKNLNKSGPIKKTKRKRLVSRDDSNEEIQATEFFEEPKIKTRKVKTKSEIVNKPVKKKRAVKNSATDSTTDLFADKKIDEDKLQGNW